jgi:hypothetical protein
MKLPTPPLDPVLSAIFDPDQKPSEEEYHRQLEARNAVPTDNRWISEVGYLKQQEFLLKLDTQRRRRKL